MASFGLAIGDNNSHLTAHRERKYHLSTGLDTFGN